MASAVDIDTEELKICIKGLLISRPTVVNANLLLRDCEQELGQAFPYRKLGFSTFVDYLKSIPNVVKLEPQNSYNPDVYPVASKASQHVDELVSRQRVAPPRRRGVARRAIYNTRPAPRKRPTIREIPQPTRSVVRPAQGIDVRDLESHMTRNYDKRELTRNGIHNVDNLLSHIEGHVERRDTKVYPKLSGESNFESGSLNRSEQSYKVDSIPAGLEDDFDDFYDDDEFYLEETEKDSEEEMSNQAIKLWSRALGEKENGSSPRSSVSVQETVSLTSKEEVVDLNEKLAEDDTHISSAMIKNFRKILTEYPGGIWASQLQQLYFEQFHVTLDLIDLGYTSAISLASSLPSVFAFQREGSHDWKLYDARYVSQASLDTQKNKFDISLSERGFIPQVIIDNIKRLLDENPNGFRSTELLKKYFDTFRKPLDLEILGFRKLEEFLMILKDDITLKKVLDYYLLLPKHKVVSYEALQPPKPDERLNIPAEALCVPIPDMVMRPGEEIPLQELPPVLMDPDPTKPLLELQVVVAEVISPAHFYMTLASRHEELENMMDDLEKFYRWEEANFKIPLPYIAVNLFCATKYQEYWHRAKITRIKNHGDVEVEFIDYGTPGTVKNSELRYLSKEFSTLPAQALCAKLIGVKPCHGETKFPKEVCETFLSLVESKRLVAYVFEVASRVRYRKERMQLEVILYDVENQNPEIVINDYLIENGFASPITQEQESSEEQPTLQLLPERESVPSQANGFEMSLPVVGLSSHPENSSSSLPGNSSSTSLQASSNMREEKKPLGPPPGFKEIPKQSGLDFSTTFPSSTSEHWGSNQRRPNSMSAEEKELCINQFLLLNPDLNPLLIKKQLGQQSNHQTNLSNMPLSGPPLFHSHQNISQQALTFSTPFAPSNPYQMQETFQTVPPVPNFYAVSGSVPISVPVFVNPLLPPGYVLMNTAVPSQYYYRQSSPTTIGGNMQDYVGSVPFHSTSVKISPVPSPPTSTPLPTQHSPAPAPTSTATPPISIPENPPVTCTQTSTGSIAAQETAQPLENNQVPRPGTPLTPASAEVANICKLSRPSSSASHKSQDKITPTSLNTDDSKKVPENLMLEIGLNQSPIDILSTVKDKEVESDISRTHSNRSMNKRESPSCDQPEMLLNEILLPAERLLTTPLPSSSSEKLYSAISSPVESSILNSPIKGESSDDYASATENVDHVKELLSNFTFTEHDMIPISNTPYETNKDIPDSWENLELDETPAKAENFSFDISKPLDLIIQNIECESALNNKLTLSSDEPEIRSQESPPFKIHAPTNWKDIFNPDIINNSERVHNNNTLNEKPKSPKKFNVEKIPIQKIEIQGKFFHLLYLKNGPAVVALEFFKQFVPKPREHVAEKIVDLHVNKLYNINKTEYPDILNELNKLEEFCGGVSKKNVIKLNKVRVLNLLDIPPCLKILNAPNQPLLDDLTKISNELESC